MYSTTLLRQLELRGLLLRPRRPHCLPVRNTRFGVVTANSGVGCMCHEDAMASSYPTEKRSAPYPYR